MAGLVTDDLTITVVHNYELLKTTLNPITQGLNAIMAKYVIVKG